MRLVLVLWILLSGIASAADRTFHFSVQDGNSCRVKDLTIRQVNLWANGQSAGSTARRDSSSIGVKWTNNAGLVKFVVSRDNVTDLEISFGSRTVPSAIKQFRVSDGYGEAQSPGPLYSNSSNRPGSIANCCGNGVVYQTYNTQQSLGVTPCEQISPPCCSPCVPTNCQPIDYQQRKPVCDTCEAIESHPVVTKAAIDVVKPTASGRAWGKYAMVGALHTQHLTKNASVRISTSQNMQNSAARM